MGDVIATIQKSPNSALQITLEELRGRPIVAVRRILFKGDNGAVRGGKGSFNLNIEILPALIVALEAAEVKARQRGQQ